jgi:transcriptional regulator with XRE-family HTH domain
MRQGEAGSGRPPALRGAYDTDVDPVRDDPGARLCRLRLRRGLSQAALAQRAGVSHTFVSMVENGKRRVTRYEHLTALAGVLGVAPGDLVPGCPPGTGTGVLAAFPAAPGPVTLAHHDRLARELAAWLAAGDRRAAACWLHRAARDSRVNPWLLLLALTGPGEGG